MNIGLDYDGTVTADPVAFCDIAQLFRARGHKVYIVTMRYPSECMNDTSLVNFAQYVDGVIPTSRLSKEKAAIDLGIKIHVWIDDHPQAVHMSGKEIWGSVSEEGNVYIVDQVTGEHVSSTVTLALEETPLLIEFKSKLLAPATKSDVVEPEIIYTVKKEDSHPHLTINAIIINEDRYSGSYSGHTYTAWLGLVPDDVDAGDSTCEDFWKNNKVLFGGGATPDKAVVALIKKLNENNVPFHIAMPNVIWQAGENAREIGSKVFTSVNHPYVELGEVYPKTKELMCEIRWI